jgi:hypothetical protein
MHAVNAGEGVEVQLQPFLTSAVQRGEWAVSNPDCFIPAEKAAGTSCVEEQVRPKDWSFWGREKYLTSAGNQTKISRFVTHTMPVPAIKMFSNQCPG